IAALAAAPIFLGWVNQCRAWLQNRRPPSIWLPYRGLVKLLRKDAVIAETASPLFRVAPYLIFSTMVTAAPIIPSTATRLPRASPLARARVRSRGGVGGASRVSLMGGNGHREGFRYARRPPRNDGRISC